MHLAVAGIAALVDCLPRQAGRPMRGDGGLHCLLWDWQQEDGFRDVVAMRFLGELLTDGVIRDDEVGHDEAMLDGFIGGLIEGEIGLRWDADVMVDFPVTEEYGFILRQDEDALPLFRDYLDAVHAVVRVFKAHDETTNDAVARDAGDDCPWGGVNFVIGSSDVDDVVLAHDVRHVLAIQHDAALGGFHCFHAFHALPEDANDDAQLDAIDDALQDVSDGQLASHDDGLHDDDFHDVGAVSVLHALDGHGDHGVPHFCDPIQLIFHDDPNDVLTFHAFPLSVFHAHSHDGDDDFLHGFLPFSILTLHRY